MQALLIAQDDSESAEGAASGCARCCLREGADMAEVSSPRPSRGSCWTCAGWRTRRSSGSASLSSRTSACRGPGCPTWWRGSSRPADRHGVFIATVAHAGDGNLHPVFVFERGLPEVPPAIWAAADEVFRAALELGGTLTGEHGVGMIKRRWLADELGAESMTVHHAIKDALDPEGIMNPGKVL